MSDIRERIRDAFHAIGQGLSGVQWAYLLVAFCFSATLWYGLTVRDKVETWVDVRLEYRGMPQNLVIRGGLVDKLSVRVRAAKGLIPGLTSRPYSLPLDLSKLVKGANAITIDEATLPFTGAYEIMEVSPSRIQILADTRETREMPVEAAYSGSLAQDFHVAGLKLSPDTVTVRGAESLVTALSRITVAVPLSSDMPVGVTVLQSMIHLPEGVTAEPSVVDINLEIAVRTKPVRVLREVMLEVPPGMQVKASPARVSIQAELPESTAHLASALAAITALVEIPDDAVTGSSILVPVRALLPESAKLTAITPENIRVTIVEGGTASDPAPDTGPGSGGAGPAAGAAPAPAQ